MKFNWKKLLFWHFFVYLLLHFKDELNAGFDFESAFGWLFEEKGWVVMATTFIAFFAYALIAYWILFKFY